MKKFLSPNEKSIGLCADLSSNNFLSTMRKEWPSFRKKREALLKGWVAKNETFPASEFLNEREFLRANLTAEEFEWVINTENTLREWGVTTKGKLTEEEIARLAPPF